MPKPHFLNPKGIRISAKANILENGNMKIKGKFVDEDGLVIKQNHKSLIELGLM